MIDLSVNVFSRQKRDKRSLFNELKHISFVKKQHTETCLTFAHITPFSTL